MATDYLEKLMSIQTPQRKRGSPKWYREGHSVANSAVQAVIDESERLGHKRNMNDLQKAAEKVVVGAPSQKLYAEAKQAAFLEIGRQLNPETRYPGVSKIVDGMEVKVNAGKVRRDGPKAQRKRRRR